MQRVVAERRGPVPRQEGCRDRTDDGLGGRRALVGSPRARGQPEALRAAGGGAALAIALLYVVSSGLLPDLHAIQIIGKISLGFLGGIGLIVMAWIVTYLYMRRSDAVWGTARATHRRGRRTRWGGPQYGFAIGGD